MKIWPKQFQAGGASDGQILQYSSTTGLWGPVTPSTVVGGPRFETDSTGALSDLTKLWSYHPLTEVLGARNDLLNRVPLTDNGTISAIAGGPHAQEMSVCSFDGSSSYLKNDSLTDWWSGATAFSGSMWVYLTDTAAAYVPLCRLNSADNDGWLLYFATDSGNYKAQFYFDNGASNSGVINSTALSAATWYHIAWAWDGTTRSLWVNGSAATDTPGFNPGAPGATVSFMVGRQNNAGTPRYWKGRLCHLAQWRGYTLTNARVTELYNSGTPNRLRL